MGEVIYIADYWRKKEKRQRDQRLNIERPWFDEEVVEKMAAYGSKALGFSVEEFQLVGEQAETFDGELSDKYQRVAPQLRDLFDHVVAGILSERNFEKEVKGILEDLRDDSAWRVGIKQEWQRLFAEGRGREIGTIEQAFKLHDDGAVIDLMKMLKK